MYVPRVPSLEFVRLKGAEAPEYPEGCLVQEAKNRLEELVLGKEVVLEKGEKDNFGRIVGFVFIDELFVDKTLVEEGLAEAASGDDAQYGVKLLGAEDQAKKAKRGIWSSACLPKGPGCVIKGNVRREKGTKIYHLPGCFNYKKIVMNEREGDEWFCKESEARATGFVKAEDCPE